MKRVYLDYASTTPLDSRVKKEIDRYLDTDFGNAGAIHSAGVVAKKSLEESRRKIAGLLSAKSDEIIFTGSGTEANNIAIFGAVISCRQRGILFEDMHFVTSMIEHSSVRECFRALEGRGATVTYVEVGARGVVDPKLVASALKDNTVLVSIMYANNEIGTIQPVREISKVIRAHNSRKDKNLRTVFHSDGSQAPLYLPLNTESLGVDLLTLDGHKIYGPKGVGLLYISRGIDISPIMAGGFQERGVRPGTENIFGIVGLAKALELATKNRSKETKRLQTILDYSLSLIERRLPDARLNGSRKMRLPNNLNISIPGIDSEFLIIALDRHGISASTKSSCLRDEPESYVIRALGDDGDYAKSSLRFSFGRDTTKADIDYLVEILVLLVKKTSRF